jgi:hypothetical protein
MQKSVFRGIAGSIILVACFGLVGCGSSDSDQAGTAVEDFLDAVGEQDYATACGFLADSVKGSNCQQKLRQAYSQLTSGTRSDLDDIDVSSATVKGITATVADSAIRVADKTTKTTRTRSGGKTRTKKKTKTTYHALSQDVTSGSGFTLTKVGKNWRISAGV